MSTLRVQLYPRWLNRVLGIVIILALIALFTEIWPIGSDYFYTYYPIAHEGLHGNADLYGDNAHGFYNMPWTVLFLLPLGALPLATGQAILIVVSIVTILLAIHQFRQVRPVPAMIAFMALTTLHTVDLLIRGQIDALLLAGVMLGWWAIRNKYPLWSALALALLATKPQNVLLVSTLFLFEIRHWPRRAQYQTFSGLVAILALSPVIAGLDWPLRYLNFVRSTPVLDGRSISIWRNAPLLGISTWPFIPLALLAGFNWLRIAWREGLTDWTFCAALTTNLVFSFYVNGYHYILLIPAFIFVASNNKWLALLAYLATWTPLLRLQHESYLIVDILYPAILLIMLWGLREPQPAPEWELQSRHSPVAEQYIQLLRAR